MDREFLRQVWLNGWFDPSVDLSFSNGRSYGIQARGVPSLDDPYRYDGVELIDAASGSLVSGSMRIDAQASHWAHEAQNHGVVWHLVGARDRVVLSAHGGELLTAVLAPHGQLTHCLERMPTDCVAYFSGLEAVERYGILHQLAAARIERKGIETIEIHRKTNDWNETAYLMVLRALGSPYYKEEFVQVGRVVPWSLLMRDRSNEARAEALLLGTAGFLDQTHPDDYTSELQRLWQHYRTDRVEQAGIVWREARHRPLSAPAVGLVRAAGMVCRIGSLADRVHQAADSVDALGALFDIRLSPYWCYHSAPSHPAPRGSKPEQMSGERIDRLLINAVVPFLWAYGTIQKRAQWVDRSIELLDQLSGETNQYTRRFQAEGIKINTALESQAVIEVCTTYCQGQGCSACLLTAHRLHKTYKSLNR